MVNESLDTLRKAYSLASADGLDADEETRFKVQEMFILCSLFKRGTDVAYDAGKEGTWLQFDKKIKNQILVEMNISALDELYRLNKAQLKEAIGSLSTKKFADRIKQQIAESKSLTENQKRIMRVNAVIALLKANAVEEANVMLKEARKKGNEQTKSLVEVLSVYGLIKERKFQEAITAIESGKSQDLRLVMLKSQLYLNMKNQKKAIENLMQFIVNSEPSEIGALLFGLTLRLASNYKLLDDADTKKFMSETVKKYGKQFVGPIIEALIAVNQNEVAFDLMNSTNEWRANNQVMGIYLDLMADRDCEKAAELQRDLEIPQPSELFPAALVEEERLTEEDCLQKLIEAAMPEKTKEHKSKDAGTKMESGGAEIFIPKRKKKKVRYPKNFDPANPGPLPDPERWLPKWQRSRFKKYAKKKGLYLKGA